MIHYLDIPKPIRADEGVVRCVAKNAKGEVECSTKLTMTHKTDYRSVLHTKTGKFLFLLKEYD